MALGHLRRKGIHMDSERKKIHAFVDLLTDAEVRFLVTFLARILNLG